MMKAGIGEVEGVALFGRELMHGGYGCRLVIVGSGMHALNAETLINFKQLD